MSITWEDRAVRPAGGLLTDLNAANAARREREALCAEQAATIEGLGLALAQKEREIAALERLLAHVRRHVACRPPGAATSSSSAASTGRSSWPPASRTPPRLSECRCSTSAPTGPPRPSPSRRTSPEAPPGVAFVFIGGAWKRL